MSNLQATETFKDDTYRDAVTAMVPPAPPQAGWIGIIAEYEKRGVDIAKLTKVYKPETRCLPSNPCDTTPVDAESDVVLQFDLFAIKSLYKEIDDLHIECSKSGWDGYDAEPIENVTCQEAKRLVDIIKVELMGRIHNVDISPGADGSIIFEWRKGNYGILTISVSGKQQAIFVLIDKDYRIKGKFELGKYYEVIDSIKKFFE